VFTGSGGGAASHGDSGGTQQADGAPVSEAVQQTVHLIDVGAAQIFQAARQPLPSERIVQESTPAASPDPRRDSAPASGINQNTGGKNDKPSPKNYCN
jgi:hypothetical protein